MSKFNYADLHCHPNLRTFGHSFDSKNDSKSDLWQACVPGYLTKKIHQITGITKFSQSDFSTMSRGKAKIIFVSLYPFEKGFFINKNMPLKVSALLANWSVEIGYNRVRYLQSHKDYFTDLINEYNFFTSASREHLVDGKLCKFQITKSWEDLEPLLAEDNTIAVIMTIEGAHVFNCGLADYDVCANEREILANIRTLKKWEYVPMFMGLAHNFNNELCGHARSLERLGRLVNQETNLNNGLSDLGIKVIHALLDNNRGKRIYIDLKHMSLKSRLEYYQLLASDYPGERIPLIVSHGSVTGLSIDGRPKQTDAFDIFNSKDLNFFDEEIVKIARSGGLFGVQMDAGNSADKQKIKGHISKREKTGAIHGAAIILWNQIQHIAEVLDREGLFSWGCITIGSDFDGSINPFPGVLTAEAFESLAKELILLADQFLITKSFSFSQNQDISAEEIVENFMFNNSVRFLRTFY